MDPWSMVAGLGIGALKSEEENKARNEAIRRNRMNLPFAQWTNFKEGDVPRQQLLANLASGAMGGFLQGEKIAQARTPASDTPVIPVNYDMPSTESLQMNQPRYSPWGLGR